MKIRLSHLRKIIRETLEEQGWVPGRWYPGAGEPVDRGELEKLGHPEDLSEDDLDEDQNL